MWHFNLNVKGTSFWVFAKAWWLEIFSRTYFFCCYCYYFCKKNVVLSENLTNVVEVIFMVLTLVLSTHMESKDFCHIFYSSQWKTCIYLLNLRTICRKQASLILSLLSPEYKWQKKCYSLYKLYYYLNNKKRNFWYFQRKINNSLCSHVRVKSIWGLNNRSNINNI